ncbi:MAG: GAF domain-containing protein [Okeania sp. SIO3H1]|nr:GAF domain-containing protein [Okeania sp. SIO3H1]
MLKMLVHNLIKRGVCFWRRQRSDYVQSISRKISLRSFLVVFFVLQISVVMLLLQWVTVWNGHQASYNLAGILHEEIINNVTNLLENYLRQPLLINQMNHNAVKLGLLDLSDLETTGRFFFQQSQIFDVSYINFANETGEFVGAGMKGNNNISIDITTRSHPQIVYEYAVDDEGNLGDVRSTYAYDYKTEYWYTQPIKAGKAIWSDIYVCDGITDLLAISASYPLYDDNQKLIGVLGVDQAISDISNFLQRLQVNQSEVVMIMERSGMLVASSSKSPSFEVINGKPKRLAAVNSPDPLTQATAQYLQQQLENRQTIESHQNFNTELLGEQYFVNASSWGEKLGLDWVLVVATPELDLMAGFYARLKTIVPVSLVAFILAIQLAIKISRWLTAPILSVHKASLSVAYGNLDQTVPLKSIAPWLPNIRELDELAIAFNLMAAQLKIAFEAWAQMNQTLEEQVEERTAQLQRSRRQLIAHNQALIDLSKNKVLTQGDFLAACQKINEVVSQTLEVKQVSIWLLDDAHTLLRCVDCYRVTTDEHTQEIELVVADYLDYFQAWENSRVLVIDNVHSDIRVKDLLEEYLMSLGITSMLDALIYSGGQVIGVICLEHIGTPRTWTLEEQNFIATLADLVALALEASERVEAERAHQLAQKALHQIETCNRAMLEAIPDLIMRVRRDGTCLDFIPPENIDTVDFSPNDEPLPANFLEQELYYINQAILTGKLQVYERQIIRYGELRYEEHRIVGNGEEEVLIIVRDITERKQAEEQIKQSLAEKEVLLKEIHHRVKNNLNIISNLLDLQSYSINDEILLHLFNDAKRRIQTMGLIHEQLYKGNHLGKVDFSEYIKQLVNNIFCSCQSNNNRVNPIMKVDAILLNLETAVPCGLLINELLMNAFKHGFPDQRVGKVQIAMFKDINQKLVLEVCDNGIGIPSTVNWETSNSLGLKLVRLLAKQLNGTLTFDTSNGTSISLIFSELKYKQRF